MTTHRKISAALMLLLAFFVVGQILPSSALQAAKGNGDDIILNAMQDELDRSMSELVLPDMQKPSFIGYLIREQFESTVELRYGSEIELDQFQLRQLAVDLRVGDKNLDNTNYYPDWRMVWNNQENLITEDNYDALRHQIWLNTDQAYKDALENLARKKAYLKANPPKEMYDDMSEADKTVLLEDIAPPSVSIDAAQPLIKAVSDVFAKYPDLLDWKITYYNILKTKRYLNSEGSKHRVADLYQLFTISTTTLAEDGERLSAEKGFILRGKEALPSTESVVAEIDDMCANLVAVSKSEPLDEYEGPVLFTDDAAAQLISQLFVSELVLSREPLVEMDWMKDYLQVGKIAKRVKRRVFPDFVTVIDDPLKEKWNKIPLAGTMKIDDEGVPAEAITLVKDGWLQTIPMTRKPTRKVKESNGHARVMRNQMALPTITNLFVSADKPLKENKMMSRLRKLCKEYGNEYALMITLLDEPYYTDGYKTVEASDQQDAMLSKPILAYKVYADDGRIEPARGLIFDEVTIRSLRDIGAMGAEPQVHSVLQPALFDNFRYSASIITPSILIEEMEFKPVKAQEPQPFSENPFFSEK